MPRISKIIFKRQFDGLTVPGVATYFKARIVNEMLYLEKDKQKHRIESPEMNPQKYSYILMMRVIVGTISLEKSLFSSSKLRGKQT